MSDLREALERIRDIAAGRDNLDGFERNRDEKQRRLVACETVASAALSAQPQPEAVEVDQIHRAMDMLGDVPGNTILERVERIVSYYLALQCELEKVRAVPPLAPDEGMRSALEKIVAIKNQEYGGDWDEIELARAIALEALSRADDASNASAEARLPGMDWELSDDAKSRIAEIDRCIVRPGDPRLNQIIGGTAFCGHGVMASICDKCADEGEESEGGVEGHAQCLTIDRQSSIGFGSCRSSVEAGIKPGPSDPTPPDATAQREAIARIVRGFLLDYDNRGSFSERMQQRVTLSELAADAILALQTRAGG